MFERFGELNSPEEINELAENLFNEGDFDSIRVLAAENGIPEDFAELYINGILPDPTLCDAQMAADGKIALEKAALKADGLMEDWIDYLRAQCLENETLARAVRMKGKSLKGMIGALLKWSFNNQHPIDKELLKTMGINAGKVTFGVPGMREAKQIIVEYYLGAEYEKESH